MGRTQYFCAPNPVQMGCLNCGLEMVKIVRKVTLHLSFATLWHTAEREQTASLFLNTEEMLEEF